MVKKLKTFLFSNETTRQTIAKNTFWLAVSNIGGRLLRSVVLIYAARVLGAASWGAFSYAISLAAFFTILGDLGIGALITRETSKVTDENERARIISTAFYLKTILLVLGIFVVVVLAPFVVSLSEARPLLPLIAFVLAFDGIRTFGFSIIRAMERMEFEAGLFLITNLAIVVLGWVFLAHARSAESFTYGYAIGTGVGTIATLFVLRKKLKGFLTHYSRRLIVPILSSAWPFAVAGILGSLMINTDVLILGFFSSAEQIGYYSATQRLIQVLYLLPSILAISVFPSFSRFAGKNDARLRSILERIMAISFLVSLPTIFGGVVIAAPLIRFIFGSAYTHATVSLQILLFTLVINFTVAILSNALFTYNRQKVLLYFSLLGATSNVLFDLMLIPPYGINGSAVATFAAQVISNYYLWREMKKVNTFEVLPHLRRIFPASLVMALGTVLLLALHAPLLFTIAASIVVYFALLVLLREPLLKEARLILQSPA